MDPATRRNLELDTNLAGRDEHTLAGVIDRTSTSMGARELRRWIGRPLRDPAALRGRYRAIADLIASNRYDPLHETLRGVSDVERMLARGPLQRKLMRNLKVYAGAAHPHEAQKPEPLDVKALSPKNVRA